MKTPHHDMHAHHGSHHPHHTHISQTAQPTPTAGRYSLALSATLHCLLGCGIGEVAGMTIAMHTGMAMWPGIILSVSLGFVAGFALGMRPWLRSGYSLAQAFKAVLIAEGLSIAVMESAEVATQFAIPGMMMSNMSDALFWYGMLLSLAAGFVAAYPVNLWMISKGIVHKH